MTTDHASGGAGVGARGDAPTRTWLAAAAVLLLCAGCGDDDAALPDAADRPPDAAAVDVDAAPPDAAAEVDVDAAPPEPTLLICHAPVDGSPALIEVPASEV